MVNRYCEFGDITLKFQFKVISCHCELYVYILTCPNTEKKSENWNQTYEMKILVWFCDSKISIRSIAMENRSCLYLA